MLTVYDISSAPYDQLIKYNQELIVERMKMDKEVSIFLDEHELRETEPDTEEWTQYHQYMDKYASVQHLLKLTEYYLGRT